MVFGLNNLPFYANLELFAYSKISAVILCLFIKIWNFKNFFSIFTTLHPNYLAEQTNKLELWGGLCWDLHFIKSFKETVNLFLSCCLIRYLSLIWRFFWCNCVFRAMKIWLKVCSNFTLRVMWDASCFAFVIPELFSLEQNFPFSSNETG